MLQIICFLFEASHNEALHHKGISILRRPFKSPNEERKAGDIIYRDLISASTQNNSSSSQYQHRQKSDSLSFSLNPHKLHWKQKPSCKLSSFFELNLEWKLLNLPHAVFCRLRFQRLVKTSKLTNITFSFNIRLWL